MMSTWDGITQVNIAGRQAPSNPKQNGPSKLGRTVEHMCRHPVHQPAEVVTWAGVAVLEDTAGALTLAEDAGVKVLDTPAGAT